MSEQQHADEQEPSALSDEELEQEGAMGLPDREAMSLISGGPVPMFPFDDASIIGSPDPVRDTMPVESPTHIDNDLQHPEEL